MNKPGLVYDTVVHRLETADLLPELRDVLLRFAEADDAWLVYHWSWGWVIPAVASALGGDSKLIQPFHTAWSLMYAAIVRLDHLQDAEPAHDSFLETLPAAARYNLLLTYYVLATSLLDELASSSIPAHRVKRLYRLWSDMMLRTASGQQRDLQAAQLRERADLDTYQELARAKTGSTFALAFGGTALLLSDDQALIDATLLVGDVFGALVQYHDDVLDAAAQPNVTLTFTTGLANALPELAECSEAPEHFWLHVYQHYYAYAETTLAQLPDDIRRGLLNLFTSAFEHASTAPKER